MNKLWYAIVIFVLLCVAPIQHVAYAQTATPTPTPFVVNSDSIPFIYADYLNSASVNWVNPIRATGLPDQRVATISAVGLPTLQIKFEAYPQPPTSYGALIGVKFDIIGKNTDNLTLFLQNNFSNLSCSGKTVSTGSTLGHNYITFSTSECSALNISHMVNGTFGSNFSYYYGAQNVSATIDNVSYTPLFASAPYNSTVKNDMEITQTNNSTVPDYEGCDSLDFQCQFRNWLVKTAVWIFGIDTQLLTDQFNTLVEAMSAKKPLGYVSPLLNLNWGSAVEATYSAIPDFDINYPNTYNGNNVFDTVVHVSASTFAPSAPFLLRVRTAFVWVLWLLFIGRTLAVITHFLRT